MWSYDETDLTNRTNEVRFLVGDTDASDPLVQDEEIDRLLVLYPPIATKPAYLAAAAVADAIAFKFARLFDRSVGALQGSFSQKHQHYKALAETLRVAHQTNGVGVPVQGAIVLAAPVLGGGGPTVLGDLGSGLNGA